MPAVLQRVTQRLRMWRGESFADSAKGVPYLQRILGLRWDHALAERVITDAILSVDEVTGVTAVSVSLDAQDRTVRYAATVSTIHGSGAVADALQ